MNYCFNLQIIKNSIIIIITIIKFIMIINFSFMPIINFKKNMKYQYYY